MSPEKPEDVPSDPFEMAMLACELSADAPEIDLHGLDVDAALDRLGTFLHHELMSGSEAIRIIHGKGEDKLRRAVWSWLERQRKLDLVAAYRGATVSSGQQNAVTYVALHRIRKS